MKYLRNLSISLTLTCALATAVFAGETGTPSCAPGEVSTPPCPAQSVPDDSTTPTGTSATSASDTTVSVTAMAEAVLWALSLF